jgi:hypothetical protein
VGAHWWNLQESALWCSLLKNEERDEISYDCTFREGLTLSGKETYTPRLIAIDCQDGLKTLKVQGSLYDTGVGVASPQTWGGAIEHHQVEQDPKNEFQTDLEKLDKQQIEENIIDEKEYDLESTVRVWSDYMRTHLHPQSLLTVPGHRNNDDRFNHWMAGDEIWRDRHFQSDIDNRIRHYLEECDGCQGYHLMYDITPGGYGSLASFIATHLQDEYGPRPLVAMPTIDVPEFKDINDQIHFVYNSALSFTGMYEISSLIVPLSMGNTLWNGPTHSLLHPSLNYNPRLPYHTSSMLAAAVECWTSPHRSRHGNHLWSTTGLLTNGGRKISCLSVKLSCDGGISEGGGDGTMVSLTPHCGTSSEPWVQSVCLRGNRLSSQPTDIARHIYDMNPSTESQVSVYQSPLVLDTPFPSVINPSLPASSSMVSCYSSLQSHAGIASLLTALHDHTHKHHPRTVPTYNSSCLDNDTYGDVLTQLLDIRDNYTVNPSADDTDDD